MRIMRGLILLGILFTFVPPTDASKDSFAFAVVADPQIPFGKVEEWERVITELNRLKPDLAIVVGDLMDRYNQDFKLRPKRDEKWAKAYWDAAGKLDRRIRLYQAAGNHDVGNIPSPDLMKWYRRRFGRLWYAFVKHQCLFIVLQSDILRNPDEVPKLAAQQTAWLEKILKKAARKGYRHKFVFLHHPFAVKTVKESDDYINMPKKVRSTLLELFAQHGVTAVFSGHYHQNAYLAHQDMELVVTSSSGRGLRKDFRPKSPPGFRIVKVYPERIEHQYYGFDQLPEQIVFYEPTVEIVTPKMEEFHKPGATVSIKTDPAAYQGAAVSRVDLYVNDEKVASRDEAPFDFFWSFSQRSFPTLQAIVYDSNGTKGSSPVVSVAVGMPTFGYLADFIKERGTFDPVQLKRYIEYYERLTPLNPGRAEVPSLLGFCYYYDGDTDEAIAAYQKAIALQPDFFWFHYNLGILYYRTGKYEEAIRSLGQAVLSNTKDSLGYVHSSGIYRQIMQVAFDLQSQSENRLTQAYRDAYELYFLSYYNAGRYQELLQNTKMAVERLPKLHHMIYLYAGLASYEMGNYKGAIKFLRESTRLNSQQSKAFHYLGLSLEALGEQEVAAQVMATAKILELSQDPPKEADLHIF